METLAEHNRRVGSAGVACDKCGAGMDYDRVKERIERESTAYFPPETGSPVFCPECGYKGRILSAWVGFK